MSPEHYDDFSAKCFSVDWLPEFSILKNGVIIRRHVDGMDRRIIVILCEEFEAHALLGVARAMSVAAAEDLARALDPLRDF